MLLANNNPVLIVNYQPGIKEVPRDGIEPSTRGFSVLCSTD
ncbi:hypothetical protein MCSV2_10372 [Mucispirillum schaedleri ASF457]|nr:hypothetical protein MCSV2_10372 [Mucispirillum schaedleri ASF457]